MYLERREKHLKILEEIEDPLIKGEIGNLWIKGTSNVSIVEERDTLNPSVEQNQRIEQTIGILGF